MFVRTMSVAFQASLCLALVMIVAVDAQAQQAGDELPVIIPLEEGVTSVLIDFDNDGQVDIVILQTTQKPQPALIVNLYRNEGNGRFTKANDIVTLPKLAPPKDKPARPSSVSDIKEVPGQKERVIKEVESLAS